MQTNVSPQPVEAGKVTCGSGRGVVLLVYLAFVKSPSQPQVQMPVRTQDQSDPPLKPSQRSMVALCAPHVTVLWRAMKDVAAVTYIEMLLSPFSHCRTRATTTLPLSITCSLRDSSLIAAASPWISGWIPVSDDRAPSPNRQSPR